MCQGGGLNLTLTADLAVASERATFRAPELLRGVADCFLGARLATRIGMARAKLLLFTAAEVTAVEAFAMLLVARVVPHAELEAALAETIERVRRTAPQAGAALERELNGQLPGIDVSMFAASRASGEGRGGSVGFGEGRPPARTGRG